jgi:hypothetical protein
MNTFGFNGNGGLNSTVDDHEERITELEVPYFGLEWNQTTDSYTRLGKAFGLSVDNSSSPHNSDFSDYYPWKGIRRCNIQTDGTVNAYYGDSGYADDGSNGQVMVEIPKFYYKTIYDTTSDNIWEWYISPVKVTGYKVHPAFVDGGIEKDFIYVGAYEAYNNVGTLESKSGVSPTVSQTIGTFRTQAQANGSGWGLLDYTSLTALQMLYLVEYGDMYSQNVLSEGITDYSAKVDTGKTISLGNGSGEVVYDTTQPMSYRGVENFYGNVWKFIDGILTKDDGYYFSKDIDNYNDGGTNYSHISSTPITTDGYGSNFENLTSFDFAYMTNTVGGSSTTYLTDYLYAHDATEINICLFGGFWDSGSNAGAFSLRLHLVTSAAYSSVGARLCYK